MRPIHQRGTFEQPPELYGKSRLRQRLEFWPADDQCELLIVGGIHGEEPDTTVLLSRAIRSAPQRSARVAVVPAANPDGSIRGTRGNARGVDLNRNFPTRDWSDASVTHRWSSEQASEVELCTGSGPASEPEIAALIELVEQLRPRCIISLHGHLACIEDPQLSPLAAWIAERTALPLVESVGYATPGSMGTWAAEAGIPIITWELPPQSIEAMYHSQLPVITDLIRGNFHPDLLGHPGHTNQLVR